MLAVFRSCAGAVRNRARTFALRPLRCHSMSKSPRWVKMEYFINLIKRNDLSGIKFKHNADSYRLKVIGSLRQKY